MEWLENCSTQTNGWLHFVLLLSMTFQERPLTLCLFMADNLPRLKERKQKGFKITDSTFPYGCPRLLCLGFDVNFNSSLENIISPQHISTF